MDYEKAYKAVLKTATQWIKDGCTDKEKICLECVFPELRESDDERIIRTLYYLVRDHDWINGATKGEALTWLEKQKESLHISESCKENSDSFTNDLEEAADNFANQDCARFTPRKNGFIAGAKWQKQHDAELIEIAYNDGITIGMTKQKEQMMKEARNHFVHNVLSGNDMKKMIEIYNDEVSCKPGNVVRVIIFKKEDEK